MVLTEAAYDNDAPHTGQQPVGYFSQSRLRLQIACQ